MLAPTLINHVQPRNYRQGKRARSFPPHYYYSVSTRHDLSALPCRSTSSLRWPRTCYSTAALLTVHELQQLIQRQWPLPLLRLSDWTLHKHSIVVSNVACVIYYNAYALITAFMSLSPCLCAHWVTGRRFQFRLYSLFFYKANEVESTLH